MSTKTETSPRKPAGRGALFGYAWAAILLAIPAWVLIGLLLAATGLALVWIGVGLWGVLLLVIARLNGSFRAMAAHILGTELPEVYRSTDPAAGTLARLRVYLTDPARWRDVAYLFFAITAGFVMGIAALVAFFIFPLGYWLSPWLLRTWAGMTRVIIGPGDSEELKERIGALEQSRLETVDASAAELRRIERDLHDGAQARLVAVAIELGMAESAVAADPQGAAKLVASARESTQLALSELRDLVRGIHPPVLADRGLIGGIEALALAHPGPVTVQAPLRERFSAPVESAAYFALAEVLTNAAKHAGAQHVQITARWQAGALHIEIVDDGTGGAHLTTGGGLEGLAKRLSPFDGTLNVVSPAGGPTRITLEIPCQPGAN